MTNIQHRIFIFIVSALLCVCVMTMSFIGAQHDNIAYAASTQYTDVLEDLQKDASFKIADYPEIYPTDNSAYSMKIIQIAEGERGELFLYVYQPCAQWKVLTATSIAMATDREAKEYRIFWLEFLDREGVFQKYKLENFTVFSSATRFYNISEIWREWDPSIDELSDNDNKTDQVAYPVQQLWTVVNQGDTVIYAMDTVKIVTITHQWAGECRYADGVSGDAVFEKFERTHTDLHFVAFSCDYNISKLFEAEVSFVSRDVEYSYSLFKDYNYNYIYGEYSDPQYVTLSSDDDPLHNPTHGIFGHDHEWKTIRSVSEFIETEELTEESKTKLKKDQWVLTFISTPVYTRYHAADVDYDRKVTEISEVAILSLKFEANGRTYNLGVVSNKVTSDHKPDTISPTEQMKQSFLDKLKNFLNKQKSIWITIAIVVAVIVVIVLVTWLIIKLVEVFGRPKVVINNGNKPLKQSKNKAKRRKK